MRSPPFIFVWLSSKEIILYFYLPNRSYRFHIYVSAPPLNCITVFPKCTYYPDTEEGLTNKSKNTNNTLEIEPNHIRI